MKATMPGGPGGTTTIADGDPREVDDAVGEFLAADPDSSPTIQRDPNGTSPRGSK